MIQNRPMADRHGQGRMGRWLVMAVLFVVALGVRGFRAWQEPVVNPDTIRFIDQAMVLGAHPLRAMRREVYHPLHSAAGLAVHEVIGGWFNNDRAAWLVSMQTVGVICGAIVALQIVRLSRLLGAPFWAGVGAGVVWTVGRRTSAFGADGLSDMLCLVFFTGSMLLGIRAMRGLARGMETRHMVGFGLAGVLSGMAYLTRPEGMGAVLILGITLLLLALPRPRRERGGPGGAAVVGRAFKLFPRERARPLAVGAALAMLLVGALVPALPYMAVIGTLTNKVPTTQNAPAAASLVLLGAAPLSDLMRMVRELWETFGFGPWLVLLLALPLRMRLWGRPRVRLVVVVWMVFWVTIMLWLLSWKGYLDGRHTLALQVLLHGLLALAFGVYAVAARRMMRRYGKGGWKRWPELAGVTACVAAAVPGVIRFGTPPLNDQFYVRDAALWIAANVRPDAVVCDNELRIGYYSGHPYSLWEGPQVDAQLNELAGIRGAAPGKPGRPLVAGWVYRPGNGEEVRAAVGPYREIMRFKSDAAIHGDVLVLYALPRDHVLDLPGAATQAAAPASLPVGGP